MLRLPVSPVIELTFDPIVTIGDWHVRIGTLALAAVILVTLVIAAFVAGGSAVDLRRGPDEPGEDGTPNHLRRDDLLYLAVAALPGAVLFGRLGYALVHLDYYTVNPAAIVDIGQGGFQLSLAIVGGTLTAAVVARLLDSPIGRWLHAMILPLLFAIGGGKVAMALGGDGQGLPWDGAWATAYTGPGPWLSLAPQVPSHASQLYEAFATAGVMVVVAGLLSAGAFAGRGGAAFLFGLALWAAARFVVAFTWRDPAVVGPLRMDQAIAIGIGAVSLALIASGALRGRLRAPARHDDGYSGGPPGGPSGPGPRGGPGPRFGPGPAPRASSGSEPDWPDPANRPNI